MIDTVFKIEVTSSDDYGYVVKVARDEFEVEYSEGGERSIVISFASLLEMEAVARAMLKAVTYARS